MFHMHDDAKILAVVVGGGALAPSSRRSCSPAGSVAPLERLRAASAQLAAGDLAARAPERGPRELAQMGGSFNAMAELDRAAVRRAARARRLGEPRPAHAARVDAGDARGDRRRARRPRRVPAGAARPGPDALDARRRPVRARAHRRRRPHRSSCKRPTSTRVVESCVRGFEAEARAQARPAPRRGSRRRCRLSAAPPTRSSACSTTSSPTRSATRRPTERSPSSRAAATRERDGRGRGHGRGRQRRRARADVRALLARRLLATLAGSGLGLAIARGLVEAQGGRIWAENRPEGGARIAFTLPAASI